MLTRAVNDFTRDVSEVSEGAWFDGRLMNQEDLSAEPWIALVPMSDQRMKLLPLPMNDFPSYK